MSRGSQRRNRWAVWLGVLTLGATMLVAFPALGGHGNAELSGSNFEIDEDANLKNDGDGVDWVDLAHPNGPELRATDKPTGQTDDSYKGGTKEDTECPNETTGSIPNNKSDLLTFHVYEEPGDPGFLNLAWSRVSDPSGTTLMDFEFNQSTTPCPQGPNVERTDGDLLIEYAIDQGGARANISGRFWDDAAGEWGPEVALDQPNPECGGNPCAVGTINNETAIPAAESDDLIDSGQKDLRTFGEAQIDLDLIFDDDKCVSFGSAMIKSRSSDSFTSQLKDFISPIPINLQNCGNVIIRKQTDPDGATATFGFTKNFPTDPATDDTFSLTDDGVRNFDDDVLFGTGYTVTEDAPPIGWDLVSLDCTASTNVDYVVQGDPDGDGVGTGPLVTFNIDSDEDELDCTYNNEAKGSITVAKVTDPNPDLSDSEFTFDRDWVDNPGVQNYDLTLKNGESATTEELSPGPYSVSELDPDPWSLFSTACVNQHGVDQGSADSLVLDAGEDITCTFTNKVRGQINILKVDDDDTPLQNVVFELFNDEVPLGGMFPDPSEGDATTSKTCTTDANGQCTISDVVPGDYWVVEDASTVPDGHTSAAPQTATISVDGTLTVNLTFVNPRERGAILITKTRKHAAYGPGDHPHDGVDFTITDPDGNLVEVDEVSTFTTDANGEICVDGLLVSVLFEGDGLYSVAEDLPSGYAADQSLTQDVTVIAESTCGDGNEATVSFGNTPLTNVTVQVDSQVGGGTSSTISCTDVAANTYTGATGADGDGSLTVSDLEPTATAGEENPTVTLTCEIVIDP